MSGARKELERAVAAPLTCHVVKLTTPVFAVIAALLFARRVPAAVLPTAKAVSYSPANITPPAVSREFRAAWVATVANIDWPSKPGLPVEQQKSEMLAILDRAVKLNLNAIIFQVRPSCDAFYDSQDRAVVVLPDGNDGAGAEAVLRPARSSRWKKRTSAGWSFTRGSIRIARAIRPQNRRSRQATSAGRGPTWCGVTRTSRRRFCGSTRG